MAGQNTTSTDSTSGDAGEMSAASPETVSRETPSPEAEPVPEAAPAAGTKALEAPAAEVPAAEIRASAAPAPEPPPYYAPESANDPRPKARSSGAGWAVALVLIVVGGVGSSPWWAPSVIPLLPWATEAGTGVVADAALRQEVSALALRVASLEQSGQTGGQMDAVGGGTAPAGGTGGPEISALLDTVRQQGTVVRDLRDRVNSFEQRLAAIPSAGASAAPAAPAAAGIEDDLKRLSDRESALEGRLAALEPAVNAASQTAMSQTAMSQTAIPQTGGQAVPPGLVEDTRRLGSDLSALRERVSRLETTPISAAIGRNDVALLFGLGQLRGAVDGGRPFAAPLATVKDSGIAATLAPLSRYADSGIPTLSMLRQSFEQIAGAIIQAGATVPPSDQLGDVVMSKIRSLVTIRRTGVGGTGPLAGADRAVAVAEAALKANDLSGAVSALGDLSAPAAKVAASWLDQAKARLQADAALTAAESALAVRAAGEAAH